MRPSVDVEGPYVELILSDRGSQIFEEVTGDNVGRRLAIVFDQVGKACVRRRVAVASLLLGM